ncbi:MAG TPA: glycosyltransferase family 39 protein, partial [Blastocatellia bacterium]|nr:glycosyltransferase family 39 protein [Blastocatellia bacterium]
IVGLVFSWERWGNPLVDCGREMNQPLRLASGEMLYSGVRHIYGPLSPYVNAFLYKIFGPSLGVLYADGIVTAMIILTMVYWLSRRLMERSASTAATLSVMWLCAFKQAGNYVLPYSYSALHGCALGLVSLALLIRFIERRELARPRYAMLALSGAVAGLAMLAKTEMGLAALSAGIAGVALTCSPNVRRILVHGLAYLAPALVLALGVYGYFVARTGWNTIAHESFLFFRNLPPELVYFNKRVSGFDQPLQSIVQMLGAAVRLASLGGVIATVSMLFARRRHEPSATHIKIADLSVSDAGSASYGQIWLLLALSIAIFVVVPFSGALNWEKGPYLAMPVLLIGLIAFEFARYRKQTSKGESNVQTIVLLVITVYALASLARVILRVRSGGAYASYLLPGSVILFTYGWAQPFADLFRDQRTRRLARNIAIGVILADAVLTAGLLSIRYRDKNTYLLKTDRGNMLAVPDLGQSMNEAIGFIKRETSESDPVAVMPEGTSLNFFTGRPNPLREEITTPGYLDEAGEARAIKQLIDSNTKLILLTNRATPEFGAKVFGQDYCRTLMGWIEQNFEECAILGPNHDPSQQIGDPTFFIRAYRKRSI